MLSGNSGVEDDGEGFEEDVDRTDSGSPGGLGLAGMHERAEIVGGSLRVESSAGGGTTVLARIPLTPIAATAAA